MKSRNLRVAVVGLGYVGLPLAVEFGKVRDVIGFDIDGKRISDLQAGHDRTREVSANELRASSNLQLTSDVDDLESANCYIVSVPTPIDRNRKPDLGPLLRASELVGSVLEPGDIVIYESTVYPGCTEDDCVPVLEKASGLIFNQDFFCGYSPERINPGDKHHRLTSIMKVTSGSTNEIANLVDNLYQEIITAGTYKAESIKVAEAAKVIENTQRDLNIALVNELAIIFNKLGIDTHSVLRAAGTKWNFLPFKPGLVGGHCISVDPYYLTHKAISVGYEPEVILAGRRINDGMALYVATQLVKAMIAKSIKIERARLLILGVAFKENCPDTRNTRVLDLFNELRDYGLEIDLYDPLVDSHDVERHFGQSPIREPESGRYDAVILAVAHEAFRSLSSSSLRQMTKKSSVIFDLKNLLPPEAVDLRL